MPKPPAVKRYIRKIRAKGICVDCFKSTKHNERTGKPSARCPDCKIKLANVRNRKIIDGICGNCLNPREDGKSMCRKCLKTAHASHLRYMARRKSACKANKAVVASK